MWIENESVEKGVVEIIARHDVRWLVMGAAADKYYSKYESFITTQLSFNIITVQLLYLMRFDCFSYTKVVSVSS